MNAISDEVDITTVTSVNGLRTLKGISGEITAAKHCNQEMEVKPLKPFWFAVQSGIRRGPYGDQLWGGRMTTLMLFLNEMMKFQVELKKR